MYAWHPALWHELLMTGWLLQGCQDNAGRESWEAATQGYGVLGACLGPGMGPFSSSVLAFQ